MKTIFYLPLFFFLLLAYVRCDADPSYIYNNETNGKEFQKTWTIDANGKERSIVGKASVSETELRFSPPFQLTYFQFDSKEKPFTYTIERTDDYLYAKIEKDGEKRSYSYRINDQKWLQEFCFGMTKFLRSNEKKLNFCIFSPKDFKIYKLVATKKKFENIEVRGEKYSTQKVRITLRGFKKMFWHALLWYEEKSHDLLLYKANEGPNTPLTTITLYSKD